MFMKAKAVLVLSHCGRSKMVKSLLLNIGVKEGGGQLYIHEEDKGNGDI